jgi:hypothetical protein
MEAVESKYRASTREVQSDEWGKANRVYEKANIDLQTAQSALQGAQAKGNKHMVETYNKQIEKSKKDVEDAHVVLDSTPKTVLADVIRPYTYTKKTVTLTASIQMQFRISDSFSSDRGEMVPITREEPNKYVQLENVKSEDTEGVKSAGTVVDSTEFLRSVETSALQSLISEVRKRVEALPKQIYQLAKSREDGQDLDGAGEAYLRYLQLAPRDDSSPEQNHAREYLLQNFNMRPTTAVAAR